MLGLDLEDLKDWVVDQGQKFYWITFIVSALFVFAGIFNIGCTGYCFSIPFYAVLIFITIKNKSKGCLVFLILITTILCWRMCSFEDNPIIFPANGTVIDLPSNWYAVDYKDGGHFIRSTNTEDAAIKVKGAHEIGRLQVEFYRVIVGYKSLSPIISSVVRDVDDAKRRWIISKDDSLLLLNNTKSNLEAVSSEAQHYDQVETLVYSNGITAPNSKVAFSKTLTITSLQSRFGEYLSNLMYYPIFVVMFALLGFL